jgi:hypothetical protein
LSVIAFENLLFADSQVRIDNEQRYEPAELRLIIERALEQLSFEQRETVVLKIYEGLKFTEIADIAGCPVSTVKSPEHLTFDIPKTRSRGFLGWTSRWGLSRRMASALVATRALPFVLAFWHCLGLAWR